MRRTKYVCVPVLLQCALVKKQGDSSSCTPLFMINKKNNKQKTKNEPPHWAAKKAIKGQVEPLFFGTGRHGWSWSVGCWYHFPLRIFCTADPFSGTNFSQLSQKVFLAGYQKVQNERERRKRILERT